MKKRLQAMIDWVEPGARLIDIGSDHLIIPIQLIDRGITSLVFASDVNDGPLETMRRARGDRNITIIASDGLKQVSESIDSAIIAGMGGRLIRQIIEDSLDKFLALDYLIVQPMQQIEELRAYLQTHFEVVAERLIAEDRKIYHLLKLRPGSDDYDVIATKGLAPTEELAKYILTETKRWLRLLPMVGPQRRQQVLDRIARLNQTKML